jgi:hypothetical protein
MLLTVLSSTLLGVAATLLLQGLIRLLASIYQLRNSEFAGCWYQVCPPSGGKTERRDLVRVRQRKQIIYVNIRRYSPRSEVGRRWRMKGYCHGNILIGVFYTTVPKKDPSSYGAIILHRDYRIHECSVWRGYYVRPDLHDLSSILSANFAKHPLIWQQIEPEVHNYGEGLQISGPTPSPPIST